jgi:hypothetical protein
MSLSVRRLGLATSLILALGVARAPAAAPTALSLSGHVARPHDFTRAELDALPKVTVDLPATVKSADPGGAHVTGVRLWPLLDQAGWLDQPGHKTHLQHVILARGRDGYTVALSIAELDPGFEGKQVLLAMPKEGKTAGQLELFVPGDKRQGRRVHDLVAIDVQ